MHRLVLHLLSIGMLLSCQALWAGDSGSGQVPLAPPSGLSISPNALQQLDGSMRIEINGLTQGERAWLAVLRDCDGDGFPDAAGTEGCDSPVHRFLSEPADADGRARAVLDLGEVEAASWIRSGDGRLWLRAARGGPCSSHHRDVVFGLVPDPCGLAETLVDTFLDGRCNAHLREVLAGTRGLPRLGRYTFEVRRVSLGEGHEASVAVPGTEGATGVTWADARHLVVTRVPPVGTIDSFRPRSEVLEIDIATGETEVLWQSDDGVLAMAPLVLGRKPEAIAFVLEPVETPAVGDVASVRLEVLRGGEVQGSVPLPASVHRLLGASEDRALLLALTLGDAGLPGLLVVDLESASVRSEPFNPAVYASAMRSPVDERQAISLEDRSGANGWQIRVVGNDPKQAPVTVEGPGQEILPAWRPDGVELAYLAQVTD